MKKFNVMHEKDVSDGLLALLQATRSYANALPSKLSAMQVLYLKKSTPKYDQKEQKLLRYYLKAFSYKYYLTSMHLESLWSLAHGAQINPTVREILINSFDNQYIDHDDLILTAFEFEPFAIQATITFDFIGLYLSCYFRVGPMPYLSEGKLIEALAHLSNLDLQVKAKAVSTYYSNEKETARRALLRSVRNALVHRDQMYPDFPANISVVDQVIEKSQVWVLDEKVSAFCQGMQNDLFYLATKLLPELYDLEWKPGPYRPDAQ